MARSRELVRHLIASGLLGLSLLTLVLDVYARNVGEFDGTSLTALMPVFSGCLLIVGVSFAIGATFKFDRLSFATTLAATACIIAAAQGVTASAVPPIDGGTHHYVAPLGRSVLEIVVLAVVLLVFGAFSLKRPKAAVVILASLLLVSITVPIYLLSTRSRLPSALDPLVTLSKDVNVIHVMFDSLQADAFQRVLELNPDLRQEFEGFAHFVDYAGVANWTTVSLAAIHSNRQFFNEHEQGRDPIEEIAGWIRDDSIMTKLKRNGWEVSSVLPSNAFCQGTSYYCTTIPMLSYTIGRRLGSEEQSDDRDLILDLALLRLVPTAIKPEIYNEGALLLSATDGEEKAEGGTATDVSLSVDLATILSEDFEVSTTKPIYKFLHFYPPHKPFILDEGCHVGSVRVESWEEYLPQATCAVKQMVSIIRKLKQLGVYDSSAIVFQSDTGLGMVEKSSLDEGPKVTAVVTYTADQLVGYARPTLLVKAIGGAGPMSTNAAPLSHLDSYRIINDASDGRTKLPANKHPDTRQFFVSNILRQGVSSVAPYEEFDIDGSVADFSSWQYGGILARPGVPFQTVPIVSADMTVEGPNPAQLGRTLRLIGSVEGGQGVEFTFLRRVEGETLEVIQDWSPKDTVEWTVADGARLPCVAELLMAARNGSRAPGEEQINVEKLISIDSPKCN